MTTTIPSAAIVAAAPVFTGPEQLALAGFLASYSGLTRDAYMLDLRQFTTWCGEHAPMPDSAYTTGRPELIGERHIDVPEAKRRLPRLTALFWSDVAEP